ncbi:MAG: hypothetical protein FP825_09920 [Hyphomonas sp.]|uniref:hypothetical protein n=1 Tax=Hyphomonas sp. TaxID=87 RepID=UPI0017D6A335|nr:hypothetical protein [Hyphomonas sp.]MBA3068786.1 hypothetical protein [Hyphomonas sp.]MBU3919245.1 hypothetical protein [Alphaproteobacteria bacterium]MBU4062719.1 hypothetical protein [Alphaproteobacteria bacterium]MBU4166227.1 hypothetical protein [Alphaproteobacteria bacterium]
MSSDPFDLLGLDRATATEADVRRAYAERLKTTRPEDDRAGFMALRAAFEQARENVRWRTEYGEDDPYEDYDEEGEYGEDYDYQLTEVQLPHDIDVWDQTHLHDLISALTSAEAEGHDTAEVARAILSTTHHSGIDDFAIMRDRLRSRICEETGLFHAVWSSGTERNFIANWTDVWDFQQARPTSMWPKWLTREAMNELDSYFQWTQEVSHKRWIYLQNDWLSQVVRELQWAELSVQLACFNRFSSSIRTPYRHQTADWLFTILQSCPIGTEVAENEMSDHFRQLILEVTMFEKRLVVGKCPDWLTSKLFNELERRFNWKAMADEVRCPVDREKRRLKNLAKRRPKHTPLRIRETAWLEVAQESFDWERYLDDARRSATMRYNENFKSASLRGFGIFLALMFLLLVPLAALLQTRPFPF